jgi:hypothetical protein
MPRTNTAPTYSPAVRETTEAHASATCAFFIE